jgi:hypothetical protein
MDHRITEEMISAFVDDELDAPDRRSVEVALAESAELRRLHAELVELRALFDALPRHELPIDFAERALRSADQRRPSRPAPRRADTRVKKRWATSLVVGTTVAAVLLGVIALNVTGPGQLFDWPANSSLVNTFVYYRAEDRPRFSLVIDVPITPRGQATRAVESVFKDAGIGFDPNLMLDRQLEQAILSSQMLRRAEVEVRDVEAEETQDEVQICYVVAEPAKIDAIYAQLVARQADFLPPFLDLVNYQDFDVLQQVNNSSRRQFASSIPDSKRSLAHRLVLRVSLKSPSSRIARIPLVELGVSSHPAEMTDRDKVTKSGVGLTPGGSGDPGITFPPVAGDGKNSRDVSEVIFVLRNLKPSLFTKQ